ncbi:MAG: mechanosensitive ion channel family protein [Candidatus Izemoplasmataceae bacterium]|uniref:mechanosensitive ion channel family protein n=1 Tax=Liberiplasma polymorphum TaxID=3374570 RepID=UPI003772C35A
MGILETLLYGLFEPLIGDPLTRLVTSIIFALTWIVVGIIINYIKEKLIHGYYIQKKGDRRGKTLGSLVSSSTNVLVWFIIILIILDIFNVDTTPILASAGILGLAIGFGAQSLVKDIVSGFFIIMDNAYNLDETIEVSGYRGKVVYMNLRVTHVQNFMGSIFVIKNGQISTLINWSRNNTTALVDFGVAYDTDLSKVNDIMPAFMETLKERYEEIVEVPSFLGVTELADSSINMRIMAKTTNGNHFPIERKIRKDVVDFLKANDVEIPFPQIVLHQAKKETA